MFVSAALSANGPSAALLHAARDGRIAIVASPMLFAEVRDVLQRERFRRFLSVAEVDELLEELGGSAGSKRTLSQDRASYATPMTTTSSSWHDMSTPIASSPARPISPTPTSTRRR